MERLFVSVIFFLAMIIFSLSFLVNAVADDKSCFIRSDFGKFYVTVWDANLKQERQDKIFEGWIVSPEHKEIKSKTGLIVIRYKKTGDDRPSDDKQESCRRKETIRIP